ncbi:MAG: hypothetical protein IPP93_06545, partial [Chitinophagaceae bacterium]|nr:hypothetical protein [Chitinophagaceae bacterium]
MVVLNCPVNTTAASCQTQAAINTQFATWLATASASGGCNGVLTNNNTGAPLACGGSTTVTFTYTSSCAPVTTTCQATFTVTADNIPPVVTTGTIGSCYASVAAAEAAALAATSATDNCAGVLVESASTVGTCSAVITVTTTDACGNSTPVTYNTRIDNT